MNSKNNTYFLFILFFLGCFLNTNAQNKVIPLWKDKIPGSIKTENYKEKRIEKNHVLQSTAKVSEPTLALFYPENKQRSRTAVIICPGGGYSHLAMNKEGYEVARWLNTLGITGIVLKYRLPNDKIMQEKTIAPLQDVQKAMRIARKNAKKWNIDPEKIGVMGFSAGGHLASTLSTHYDQQVYQADQSLSAKPNFSILIYPVISMKDPLTHKGSKMNLLGKHPSQKTVIKYSNEMQVNSKTPPAFLVHAANDRGVSVENSIAYFLALKKYHIPTELHVYQKGGHGFGLGNNSLNQQWPATCAKWLMENQFIERNSGK